MNGVFSVINESCINVSKHALVDNSVFDKNSKELINALEKLLRDLKSIDNPELNFNAQTANYVFFPISHVLNKDEVGNRIMELVMQVLEFLFNYGWNSSLSIDHTRQLLAVILYFISGPPGEEEKADEKLEGSDETKLCALNAMNALYKAACNSTKVGELFTLPMIAKSITVALDCLEFSNIAVQLAAIDMLNTVLFRVIGNNDALSVVLPAVLSKFTKLITNKLGVCNFKVLVPSLKLVGVLLSKVYSDKDLATNQKNRTPSWLKGSKEQVRISLSQIVTIRSHTKLSVQKSMLEMCQVVLDCCIKSLDVCISILVDTVVFYMDADLLRGAAEPFLSTRLSSNKELQNVLQDRVYTWIESIPRLFTNHDDTVPVLVLNSIKDGIKLLEDTNSVDCESMQEALMTTLSNAVVIEKPKYETRDLSFKFDPTKMLTNRLKKGKDVVGFDNLGVVSNLSVNTQNTLIGVLNSLGSSQLGLKLFEQFLNRESSSDENKLSNFWMAVNLLKGATDFDEFLSIANNEIDDCIYDTLEYSHEIIEQGTLAKNTKTQTQESIIAIALDAISICAQHMGKEFKYELVENIYPIVSYLGSSNSYVREQAQRTILKLVESCGYLNIQDLLVSNADYLVDGISIKLNTLDITPNTATILSTLISMAGSEIAPYMNDLVGSMFIILDNYHGYNLLTEGIFKVLQTLVHETMKGYDVQLQLQIDSGEKKKRKMINSYEELRKELQYKPEVDIPLEPESHGNKPFGQKEKIKEVDSDDDEEEFEEPENLDAGELNNAEEAEDEKWTSVVERPSYELIHKIVSYADTYLTHESTQLRYNLLELIQDSIPLLSTTENNFLPIVNEIWPIIESRLTKETEIHILEQVLTTISKLCQHSKSFMSKRIEHVWPVLLSMLPNVRIGDKFSLDERRFKAIINTMSIIIENTPLPEKMVDGFIKYIAPVLGREEFLNIKNALEKVNPDAVWLEMAITTTTEIKHPPHSSVEQIQFCIKI